jgi:hypothetical protein
LNLGGRDLKSLTRIDSPIKVAILQCGIVGENSIFTLLASSSTCNKRKLHLIILLQ